MNKKQTKETIMKTVVRLFYKQGYSNTGINQIVEESKIAKSSLYQNYRSKEELLISYLELTGKQTIITLRVAAEQKKTSKEKVIALFEFIETEAQKEDFFGCHLLNMVYELPEGDDRIRKEVKKQKDQVRRLLCEITAPEYNESTADEIYTLLEGALIGFRVHNAIWPITAAKNIVKKIL